MLESTVVEKIKRSLEARFKPIIVIKIHGGPFQKRGLPDLFIIHRGIFCGLEVKVPGKENTLTPLQNKWLKRIRAVGGIAEMVTSPEQAIQVMEDGLKKVISNLKNSLN